MIYPSVLTWAYFVALSDWPAGVQQAVYGAGKLVQFAWPALWVFGVRRAGWSWRGPTRRGLCEGAAFGLLVLAAALGLYFGAVVPRGLLAGAQQAVRAKIVDLGFDRLPEYVTLALFYSLLHSLLEEYYWRWFVFGRLRPLVGPAAAGLVSSVAFMAHHVILLGVYFGWSSPAAWLFSAAVAVGGAVWAWLYHRQEGLWGPWLSHLLVDAAIFIIGGHMAADLFR